MTYPKIAVLVAAALFTFGAATIADPASGQGRGEPDAKANAVPQNPRSDMVPAFAGVAVEPSSYLTTPRPAIQTSVPPPPLFRARPQPVDFEGTRAWFPQDPAATRFIDSWGFERPGGRAHRGTDLMAPKMSPVYAFADGVIIRLSEGRSSGRMAAIEHGSGYTSWYMHLNDDTPGTDDGAGSLLHTYAAGLAVGDPIAGGDLVGYVGDSGNAEHTDPHTHFELHRYGTAFDPYPVLARLWERRSEIAGIIEIADRYLEVVSSAE